MFPNAFLYQLFVTLEDTLSQPEVYGSEKKMDEDGIAYAFYFTFEEQKMYAKVLLHPDGKVIIIYSAHRPQKEKL